MSIIRNIYENLYFKNKSNNELIELTKSTDLIIAEKAWNIFFVRNYYNYKAFIKKYTDTVWSEEDFIQEASFKFINRIRSGKLIASELDLAKYYNKIVVNIALKTYKNKKSLKNDTPRLPINEPKQPTNDEIYANIDLANRILKKLGEPCKSILIKFYSGWDYKQLLNMINGYSNIESIKNKKYNCFIEFKKIAKNII